jgi:hypothetical protein
VKRTITAAGMIVVAAIVDLSALMLQPQRLINSHTAGMPPKKTISLETGIYPSRQPLADGAGITFNLAVGVADRFMFGTSYGADGLVGRGRVRGNPWPGLLIKFRMIEEHLHFPAIAIGFDWQGSGGIEGYLNGGGNYAGYVYKSPGFFLAISKNYLLFRVLNFGTHLSVNYSLEEHTKVSWPNGVIGLDLGINDEFAIVIEYDLALNEKDHNAAIYHNPLMGFLNAGVRWAFSRQFFIEFSGIDLLQQKLRNRNYPALSDRRLGWSRQMKFVYIKQF